jgi:hypothetical protein
MYFINDCLIVNGSNFAVLPAEVLIPNSSHRIKKGNSITKRREIIKRASCVEVPEEITC